MLLRLLLENNSGSIIDCMSIGRHGSLSKNRIESWLTSCGVRLTGALEMEVSLRALFATQMMSG